MKKISVLLIALTMLFTLVSCGDGNSSEVSPATPAEGNVATVQVGCDIPIHIVKGAQSNFEEAGLWGDDYVSPVYNFSAVDFTTAGDYPATVYVYTVDNTHLWSYDFTVRVVEP